ncbi:protein-disulfide reductase DsbD domain-containing protein, partial [Escherichia coli]|uniref:protein-disulfide reductase DsbD domain-containing protein n=1 Tax=Escherichia coli TaxID=562 RepID=UPI003EDE9C18
MFHPRAAFRQQAVTKDGYYLYRKQVRITPEHAKIADVQLPQGVWHEDEFYGKSEIY